MMINKEIILSYLFSLPQYLLPHHALSKLMFKLTRAKMGGLTHRLIRKFVNAYAVDMSLAQEPDINKYQTFNEFFTRALKPDARPIAPEGIVSPVDGVISQIGEIVGEGLVQAKGYFYSLNSLLGGIEDLTQQFRDGTFCTIYLSPRDYHRIHLPFAAQPKTITHVPGRLFSVNPKTVNVVNHLFARNERVIVTFETEFGSMALIMVGAIFVGSVDLAWLPNVAPSPNSEVKHWLASEELGILSKGAEVGRFNMGSTVIVLFGEKQVKWLPHLSAGDTLQMGQALAKKL
ncbi:MAG: phosphatidylserine decarboxylase [Pseudomonadota bacterium]|jgi:phosphatidylserine decarboxylase